MKANQHIIGKAASLYLASAYLAGIIIFVAVLKYPAITDEIEKVKMIAEMKSIFFICHLLMYVLFGPVLVLFILFLKSRMANRETLPVRFASVIGFIWAGSLTASGMITNAAIGPVSGLFAENQEQAVYLWQILDTVATAIGNGNGEILGGLMTLCFGIAMFTDDHFSNFMGIFGIIIGSVGIITVIPILTNLTIIFGILQLVWFVLSGFSGSRAPVYKKKVQELL